MTDLLDDYDGVTWENCYELFLSMLPGETVRAGKHSFLKPENDEERNMENTLINMTTGEIIEFADIFTPETLHKLTDQLEGGAS